MRKLLLIVACLMASGFNSVSSEIEGCPSVCSCHEESVGNLIAHCSSLDPELKFGSKISRVKIENDIDLVLDKTTFEAVGLENVSTIQIWNSTFKKLNARAFSGLKFLRTIEFQSNKQLLLDPDMFNEIRGLRQLVVKDTELKFSRKSDYLFDIPLLTELVLSSCGIMELNPDSFSKMTGLHVLNLSHNKLKILTTEFSNLTELEDADLSYNLLSEVGPEVFENTDLTVLNLRGNPLTSMADVQLVGNVDIDISMCKFSKIDKATFLGFSNIQLLNLSGNALSEIAEDSFRGSVRWTHIDLSKNALQGSLPEGLFQEMPELGVLNLAHNPKLGVLPEKIFEGLVSLFRLDISFCGLKTLENNVFEGLYSLSILNLAGNSLYQMKPGVLNKAVVNLDLSHNKIEHLDEIKFPADSRLRTLNLAGNKLSNLSSSALSDLNGLETLDLSSCSLSTLWVITDASSPSLKSLQTLSVANNFISVLSKDQLSLTPKLMGLDISNNPMVCNDTFTATLHWLRDHGINPSTNRLASLRLESFELDSESENVNPLRWGEVREQLCGEKENYDYVDDDSYDNSNDEDEDEDEEDDEDDEDNDENDEDANYTDDAYSTGIPNNLDNIVWRKSTILAESNDNYLWSVIIVLFSVVAILFSLTILAACVLRWSRQRNSFGARMINTHLHPPMMKRGRSSIYQQLYEDPNHPTTPIMSMKNQNQTQYNFPEGQGGKQFGYITYLSKDFHDSTVIPENV